MLIRPGLCIATEHISDIGSPSISLSNRYTHEQAGFKVESKPIEDLLKAAPDDLPIILLKHTPTSLESISRSRVDLQLSGHTHNGQLFPFNLVVRLQYELAYGIRVKRNTLFIVSSGVRSWGPPVKTAGYSEILYIKAVFRSDIKTPKPLGAG